MFNSILQLFNKKYSFNPSVYNVRFFEKLDEVNVNCQVEKVIYCFWTGDNPLTDNRQNGLNSLVEKSKVKVVLVTPDNLGNYILPDFPLHPAYQYLSLVHKSDYLRCYFMHHWGGGYSDIKPSNNQWDSAFDYLNRNSNIIAVGYQESDPKDIGYMRSFVDKKSVKKINNDLKLNYKLVIGNCSYIFKPKTQFTKLWINELHQRLDENFDKLKLYPGNTMGDNEGYPLPWTSILGQIFHPLCLIFYQNLYFDENLKPSFENYR
ncbi:MAG: hypothetical protein RSG48_05845 [Clostridia bacterium]